MFFRKNDSNRFKSLSHKILKTNAYFLLIGVLYYFPHTLSGQIQRIADSLANIYHADTVKGEAKLELLRNLSFNEMKDLKLKLEYAEELIRLSQKSGNLYLHRAYLRKGDAKKLLGELEEALEAYIKSSEFAKTANNISREGLSYGAIADIYDMSSNFSNAMLYYDKAITLLRKSKDSLYLAAVISNAGDALLNNKDYDTALVYFKESGAIFEQFDYLVGKAYNLGNIGMVYANIGQNSAAEKNINAAIQILEETGDFYPICVYLISMSDLYIEKGDQFTALNYAKRSLALAQQYGLKEQISDANLKLSQLHEKEGNTTESLKHYKAHIAYRDSVNNIHSVQAMADLRTDYEVSQKQIEVDLLTQQKRDQRNLLISLFIILGLTFVILVILYRFYRAISREKKRSEKLLLNILPIETAEELKLNGKVAAIKFDEVTVLFTDFVEFSKLAEKVEPEQLVKSIDFYFKGFDEITTKHGLEKIKTIGDSYMCACGLPKANNAHAKNVINAGKEMINLVRREINAQDGLIHFEVRIGIHTGPVVAGIVGIKKWQYDIWGDTVNIASRMESNSEPGRINISESTYNQIKDEFTCEYRGEIEVKNRGELKMYFLS